MTTFNFQESSNRTHPWVVLHVAINPSTGVWTVIRELVRWQGQQAGVVPAVFIFATPDWPRRYHDELASWGVEYKIIPMHLPRVSMWYLSFFFVRGVKRMVEFLASRLAPERIIVHLHDAFISGTLLPIGARTECPIKPVTTYHGMNERGRESPLRRMLYSWLALRTVRHGEVVSVDEPGVGAAHRMWNMPADRFHIVPNGLPPTTARGCPFLRDPQRPFTVAFVGNIDERKGWLVTVEAVRLAAARGGRFRLLLAGEGEQCGMLREWLQRYPGLAEHLGYIPEVRERLLPEADVLVLPSLYEGLPMSILEALSCGVPCLATPVGGIPQAVHDGSTGFLVTRDAPSIAMRLEQLAGDPELLGRLSAGCLRLFSEKFSITACGEGYLRVYNSTP